MIKEIREYFGIPQNLMAGFLGISRSRLSMAEIGKRELSSENTLFLIKLYKAMQSKKGNQQSRETQRITSEQKLKREKRALEKIKENEDNLVSVQKSLNKLKEDHQKAIRMLESLEILKENVAPKAKGFVEIIKLNAEKLYKTSGGDSQLILELKLQQIKTENDFLKKIKK